MPLRRTLSAVLFLVAVPAAFAPTDAAAQEVAIAGNVTTLPTSSLPARDAPDVSVAWDEVVDRVSQFLVHGDASGLSSLLPDSVPIVPFARQRVSGVGSLVSDTDGCALVSSRAYTGPSSTMASDLASDLRGADRLPADLLKALVLENDQQARRANATASQWARTALGAIDSDPIAFIVLYSPGTTDQAHRARLNFVLVKGEKTPAGTYRIVKIIFGDPLEPGTSG